jgi:hypothetical protein
VAANCVACIITTEFVVLAALNILMALIFLCAFLFLESRFSGLATDLGISKQDARQLVCDYFSYYRNVEKISVYEYHSKSLKS